MHLTPGFRRGRSCTDLIAALRIVLEQSCKCNSHLNVSFIDYEKAFDSLDWESLWKLLGHYGLQEMTTSIIRNSYSGMACRMVCGRQLTDVFQVKTGVRPGAGIMEADDRQMTTVFTVQPSFHYRPSTNPVSWSVTIVGERRGEVWLHVRRRWQRFMIHGLPRADSGMTVEL